MQDTTCPEFHRIVENEVKNIEYGTLTFMVIVRNKKPIVSSLNVQRNKRLKYKDGKRL